MFKFFSSIIENLKISSLVNKKNIFQEKLVKF